MQVLYVPKYSLAHFLPLSDRDKPSFPMEDIDIRVNIGIYYFNHTCVRELFARCYLLESPHFRREAHAKHSAKTQI